MNEHIKPKEIILMNEIQEITDFLVNFRNEREWEQFHNTKNLAIAIGIEAAELNEIFLWKSVEESENADQENIQDELADILVYSLLLAHKHGFNIKDIIMNKMVKNAIKYPVHKARGNAKKYTEF